MYKRDLLKMSSGAMVMGAAMAIGTSKAAETVDCGRVAEPATFVLVPGAFTGAFGYAAVAENLRSRGHRVFAITLTGLAERSHLISPDVSLTTHITDVLNLIRFNELEDVVLAGHSYGGMVITGVADSIPDKIRSLVYLDAMVPEDGQSAAGLAFGAAPPAEALENPPPPVPMPPSLAKTIPEASHWRYTPQPSLAFLERIRLTGAHKSVAKKTFVWTRFSTSRAFYDKVKDDPAWETRVVDTGHDLAREAPALTAEILENAI